jgi:hypothetical protein
VAHKSTRQKTNTASINPSTKTNSKIPRKPWLTDTLVWPGSSCFLKLCPGKNSLICFILKNVLVFSKKNHHYKLRCHDFLVGHLEDPKNQLQKSIKTQHKNITCKKRTKISIIYFLQPENPQITKKRNLTKQKTQRQNYHNTPFSLHVRKKRQTLN